MRRRIVLKNRVGGNTANTASTAPAPNTNGNVANNATNNATNNPTVTTNKISFGEGVINFVKGALAGSIAFFLAYWILSLSYFEVGYILKSVISLIFAFLVIKAYDKASGEVPTPMSGAVVAFVLILFTLSLLKGYKENDKKITDIVVIESGTLHSAGDVWFTNKIFETGSTVEIEVIGNNVKIVDGNTLFPGTHRKSITSNGKLAFIGMHGPSTIKVTYK